MILGKKETQNGRVRPPRDIDIVFRLPYEIYQQFERRSGNRQSQLLQDVRSVLLRTYPQTNIRGDNQVVDVPFNTSQIEIVPAFSRQGGGYLICDTPNSRYKYVDPVAELAALDAADLKYNGNVRKLTRIMKQWQRYSNADIKSFQLEAVIKETLSASNYGGESEYWFDWLVADVLRHLIRRAGGSFSMPVSLK